MKSNLKKLKKCFTCGSHLNNNPKFVYSRIKLVPEGLDRSLEVKAFISKCKICGSISCLQVQNRKKYTESLCYEASKKTLQNSKICYPYSSNLIPNSLRKIIKNHIFIDYGCGAGFFSKEIKKYVKEVIGVDLDPNAVKSLQEININAMRGDIKVLKKLKFNSISLVGVLEHFRNPLKFLDEINQILPAKDSVVLIYYPNYGSLSSFLSRFSIHSWDMFLEPGHYSFPSKKYLIKYMTDNNFVCKKYWTTTNISRGKNPFYWERAVLQEKFIRKLFYRFRVFKFFYIILYQFIDFFRLGDINCFLFYR